MTESERLLVIWAASQRRKGIALNASGRVRPLRALTDPSTTLPLAFTRATLDRSSFFARRQVATADNLSDLILVSTEANPVLVPVSVAAAVLGWSDVTDYLPTEI